MLISDKNKKSSFGSFFGSLLKLIKSFCQTNYHCVLVEFLTIHGISGLECVAHTSVGIIFYTQIKFLWQCVNEASGQG
jgi:hypothetical protein